MSAMAAAVGVATPAHNGRPVATLDPQLLMAARRGDSKLLKVLLQLKDEDEMKATRNGILETNGVTSSEGDLLLHVVDSESEIEEEVHHRRPQHGDDVASSPPPSPPPAAPSSALELPDGVTIQGDSLLHVVASCGDGKEFLHCAEMIYDKASRLLVARNTKGDTPLHSAAGAGNAEMISHLIFLAARDEEIPSVEAFLRMQNERGETALHHAVCAAATTTTANNNNKLACIKRLMAVHAELACIQCEEGISPLYLAISLGEVEIAQYLFNTTKGKLSYSGPDGRNVLHAAVSRGQVLRMILDWLKDVKKTTVGQKEETGKAGERLLLSQLTSQRDKKEKGSTPIHLAASLGGWPDAWSLARRFPQVWAGSWWATELLLDANISTAYQADDEGLYPIHVAAMAGSLGVVMQLLQRCPDCATLRDLRGRTFLHVAVYKKRYIVVKHVCKTPQLSSILNAQDSNGDTALHGAVRAGNLAVFNCLLRNRQVRLDVPNKCGMTPLDLSRSMIPSGLHYVHNPRLVIRLSLLHAGAPYCGGRAELFHEKHITKRDVDKESEKYTHATQAMSIVAVLIATVTFASAFTLPGGYRGDSDAAAPGTAVLAGRRSYTFDAFILADASAFICSTLATCTLVYAGVPAMDIDIRHKYVDVSSFLLQSSARSFVAAFALGLYLVLAPVDRFIAVAVCVIVFASSLGGNMGALQITCAANTVRARIGIRRFVVQRYARRIFLLLLVHFGSYILIFGLPAIRKWHQASHKMS